MKKNRLTQSLFSLLLLLICSTGYSQSCDTELLQSNLYSPSLILTCDFNGDNREDIIFVDSLGYNLWWKRNTGNDQFSAPIPLVGGAEIKFLETANLNNDNFDDILFATGGTVYYIIYTGVNTIDFQNLFSVPLFYSIQALEVGDFNNDGSDGFVLGYYRSSTFNLEVDVFNNDNANISVQNILSGTFGILSDIAVGDITGNNRMDIATAGYSNFWFRNISSTGQFSSETTISSASSDYGKIVLMDYDNDNDVELVNLDNNGTLQSYDIDISGGGWLYSPVTILSNLPASTDVWELVNHLGSDYILIKSSDELIGLKHTGNSFTQNSICTNINGLKNATLLTNQDNSTDFIYTNDTQKTIRRIETSTASIVTQPENQFQYYPNPTTGIINITGDVNIKNIKLINTLGQTLSPEKVSFNQYDISAVPGGLYQLIIEDENGQTSTKSIVKID